MPKSSLALGVLAIGSVSVTLAYWFFNGPKLRLLKRNRALQAQLRLLTRGILADPGVLRTELRGEQVVISGRIPKAAHKAVLAALYAIPEVHDVVDALSHLEHDLEASTLH